MAELKVSRALPTVLAEGAAPTPRGTRYGELSIPQMAGNLFGYNEDGSVLVATSGTIGTGLTGVTAQTAYNATGPAFYLANNEAAGGKSLHLVYIKMIASAAATSTTSKYYAGVLDTGGIRPITTDNFAVLTQANPSGIASASYTAPTMKWQNNATVSVVTAATSGRTVCRGGLGGLNIIGDEMIVTFGQLDFAPHAGLTAAQAAAPSKRVSNAPPVAVAPGQTFTFHTWALAQAAADSPEVEICIVVR